MVNVLDYDIVVSEFELQSCYCAQFGTNTLGKGMDLLIQPPGYGLNSATTVLRGGAGGAGGVMVILEGNGHGDTSLNPGRG